MKTVLGIFCKQPIPGKVKTRLAADIGAERAARLYEAFLRDIVERMREAADQRILCYAPNNAEAAAYFGDLGRGDYELVPQAEGDLGDRLAGFFADILRDGRGQVIVIGSDSPTITTDTVQRAADELDCRDAVLGRSDDGGYYLIGLSRMTDRLFERIDWSTSAVYDQQHRRLTDAGFVTTSLVPVPEIDTIDDLQQLRRHPLLKDCRNTCLALHELELL